MFGEINENMFSQKLKKLIGEEMATLEGKTGPAEITMKFNELITTLEWFRHRLMHNMSDLTVKMQEIKEIQELKGSTEVMDALKDELAKKGLRE